MGTGATLAGPQPQKAGPRTFWVRVPADYDPNHAYRVVYLGQGCGGSTAREHARRISLFTESAGGTEEAIYVALDLPTDRANMDCYDNRDGPASQEWEAFELFHDGRRRDLLRRQRPRLRRRATARAAGSRTSGAATSRATASTPRTACRAARAGRRAGSRPAYHLRGQAVVTAASPTTTRRATGPWPRIWIHDTGGLQPHRRRSGRARARAADERLRRARRPRRGTPRASSAGRVSASSTRPVPGTTPSSSARPRGSAARRNPSARSPPSRSSSTELGQRRPRSRERRAQRGAGA